MKRIPTILIYLAVINSLWAVNKYSINDTLYVIAKDVNFRSEPNLNSKVLDKLSLGTIVTALQLKYDKTGDKALIKDKSQWQSALTGKWTKIKFGDKIGYIFDAYLSHYNFSDIESDKFCISHDTILVEDYERYTRTMYLNGIITESGIGMEWGIEMYMIPDFTYEEALLFIKPNIIDESFGNQKWLIEKSKIDMKESDGISYLNLEIVKYGEYIIIKYTFGV